MIVAQQIRAARSLLGLTQQQLALKANCGIATIRRIEACGHDIGGQAQTVLKIQTALETAGAVVIDADAILSFGVRLRHNSDF